MNSVFQSKVAPSRGIYLMAFIGGAVASYIALHLGRSPYFDLSIYRVWGLMDSFGLSSYKGWLVHYAVLFSPEIVLCFLGGITFGFFGYALWIRNALAYASGYFLVPVLVMFADGSFHLYSFRDFGRYSFYQGAAEVVLACFPFALGGAWLSSRGKRRRAARREAGLCVLCGYDLTGNTSGVCPECGAGG